MRCLVYTVDWKNHWPVVFFDDSVGNAVTGDGVLYQKILNLSFFGDLDDLVSTTPNEHK